MHLKGIPHPDGCLGSSYRLRSQKLADYHRVDIAQHSQTGMSSISSAQDPISALCQSCFLLGRLRVFEELSLSSVKKAPRDIFCCSFFFGAVQTRCQHRSKAILHCPRTLVVLHGRLQIVGRTGLPMFAAFSGRCARTPGLALCPRGKSEG